MALTQEPRPAEAQGISTVDLSYLSEPGLSNPDSIFYPHYEEYSQSNLVAKLYAVGQVLEASGVPSATVADKYDRSVDFVERVFREQTDLSERDPGSFAFVVPTRAERGNNYAPEWSQFYPLLDHVDPVTAQLTIVGTPPYVVDEYGLGQDGRRGYMTFAPFFSDMMHDLSPDQQVETGAKIMQDGVDFAERLGVQVIGLGATLPKLKFLFDAFGSGPNTEGAVITTGHAGTVWLIGETFNRAVEDGRVNQDMKGTIGVIGAGSIGTAASGHLLESAAFQGNILISDRNGNRLEAAEAQLRRFGRTETTQQTKRIIEECDTIVCAVTSPISLAGMELRPDALNGTLIIDDSQPGCFDPAEVSDRGGLVAWPIAKDPTEGLITNQAFHYNGYGPAMQDEAWGCQVEAAVLALSGRTDLAVGGEVTGEDVKQIGRLLEDAGVGAAPLQTYGTYI